MAASTMLSTRSILDKKAGSGKSARKRPAQPPIKCPECDSLKTWKDGFRYTSLGPMQRYICRNCGYRFSDPRFQHAFNGSDMSQHVQNVLTKKLKRHAALPNLRQVCVALTEGAKNLAEVEARQEKPMREGTTQTAEVKGKLLLFMVKLKNEGIHDATIQNYSKMLRLLTERGANLYDPDSIKETIAKQNRWAESTKQLASIIYGKFAQLNGITWKAPRYKANRKIPFIPLESEIDSLVCSCGKKLSALLRLLKESGLRVGEALRLEWKDIDAKNCTITLNKPEKYGVCRMFKVSNELIAILHNIPKKSDRIFGNRTLSSWEGSIALQRRKAAIKLQNPRLLQIHFHTLRHWKATMEYAKTKDILHVMKVLGHRNIQTTLIYTQLINFESNEYHSATAQTIEEASKLIEAGFEYVCKIDNVQLFRKRK